MKRFNRRLKAFLLSLLIALDIPLIGYSTALAADAATYRTGLAPLETLVAAVVIGSGIVAGQSQKAVDALVTAVSNAVKDNTVRKAQEDPAFESPYRVIQGGGSGSNPTPEQPNNSNKNGRWFGLVGASSLGSALMFEKGAVEEIMQTIKDKNGYNSISSHTGIVSADALKTQSTSGQISLQLANISNSAVSQFDTFLHSDFFSSNGVSIDDFLYFVSVNVNDVNSLIYPELSINMIRKSDLLKNLLLGDNTFGYRIFNGSNISLSYYYIIRSTGGFDFLNENNVSINLDRFKVFVRRRNSNDFFFYKVINNHSESTSRLGLGPFTENGGNVSNPQNYAYCGYKWAERNDWSFTNNVYNQNQTFNVNFPDWLQQSITLLGKQIDAVNLGLQNLSKINWAQTQPQIQTAPASEAAAAQAVNNWENPGNIPEPEPNPNPDPEPEPEPDPETEPAHEAAVTEGAESIYNWVTEKITLPAGIFEKIPFSIPYDLYLLLRSMFPTSNRVRKKAYFTVSNVQSRSSGTPVLDPNGITISSHFDAVAKNTKSYEINWKPAPVINLDLHFSYTDVGGQKKALDIVKSVDLQPYSYFAMIVYIGIYISWLIAVLGWIMESFR